MSSVQKIEASNNLKTVQQKKNKHIKKTKNGNEYYHTNLGKKVGAGAGLAVSVLEVGSLLAITRNVKASLALSAIPSTLALGVGLGVGAVVDGVLNKNEKQKVDAMA